MELKVLKPFNTTVRRLKAGDLINASELPAHVDLEQMTRAGYVADTSVKPAKPGAPSQEAIKSAKSL